jgi:hypothetical protein
MAPRLVAGHVHQALREGGMQIALIWPTPWPDRWHVGLTTTLRWATRDPVPGSRVFDVLQAWGFELDQHTSFCHWRWVGPPPNTNPMRQQMSRVRELDQAVGLTLERSAPIRVWLGLGPRRRSPAGLSGPP